MFVADTAPTPHVLLVEDDAVSRSFLQAVLESAPARVTPVETGQAALLQARGQSFDAWLIDANLPDMRGEALLSSLRLHCPGAAALAHTADSSAQTRQRLLTAGFAEVLLKPLAPGALLQALDRQLANAATVSAAALPDWDLQAALRALNGQQGHVEALRGLFLDELPTLRDAVGTAFAQRDDAGLSRHLHRLQASCGFVGAARLGATVRGLQAAPDSQSALDAFTAACQALLDD